MKTAVRREPYRGFESHTLRDDRLPASRAQGRLWPPLLLVASLVMLPLLAAQDASPGVIAYVLVVALSAGVIWLTVRVRPVDAAAHALLTRFMAAAAVVGLLLVLLAVGRSVLDLLLVAIALCVAVAVSPDRGSVWVLQTAVLVVLCVAMVRAGVSWPVTAAIMALCLVVVMLADVTALRLFRIRDAEQQARRAAERRRGLLEAVRDLPRGDVEEAERAVTRTLRQLAFDGAGVAVIEGEVLVERMLDGLASKGTALRRGEGLAWRAIEQDRTLTVSDYEQLPERLESRRGARGMVVTPIRIEGRPVGVLVGVRADPEPPSDDEVEVAEVMAAHLGGVLANHAGQRRQRLLLEQAAHLDRISQSLLEAVSEEVRDPLTVLRLGTQLLRQHGGGLDTAERVRLLGRVRRESDDLRLVIDTILDFSRYHARRVEPRLATVPLTRLLATCDVDHDHPGSGAGPLVRVDLELLVPALRLLFASGVQDGVRAPWATVRTSPEVVTLAFERRHVGPPSSVLVQLAVQLLSAGGGQLEVDDDTSSARIHLDVADAHAATGERP